MFRKARVNTNRETLKLYWRQIRKYKISFYTMTILIPVASLLTGTAVPYFLAEAIGTLAEGSTDITELLVLSSIIAVVGIIANVIGFQAAVRHESYVRKDLVHDTFSALLSKDHDFFSNQKIGALTSKFIDFINGHIGLQDLFIIRTLSFVLTVGAGLIIIFLRSPLLGFIILGLIAWLWVQISISMRIRRPYRMERKKLVAEVNGVAADAIAGNLIVKTFAGEQHESRALDIVTEKFRRSHVKDFSFLSIEGSLRLLIMSIVQIAAVAVVAMLLTNNTIDVAIAIFVLAYLQRLATQLFSLGELINGYDRIFIQAAPMTEILHEQSIVNDATGAKDLIVTRADIAFEDVTYSYQDAKHQQVVNAFNISIPAGQKIGLVGHSGAGKTTITKLLLRFADIDEGMITIDGQDISTVTQESLRRAISYVPQEPLLFHRSLAENIAYGKPDATEAEIRDAAKKANAIEFIDRLNDGLRTIVGERGVKLSGGQRQRIAIARAILKDAPILVLDEATSALDSESERLIQDALKKLMRGRTSIVIAHRLSTIAKLDRIVVMDNGKIVEDGTHTELLTKKNIYANLWSHQSGGFIEE